MCEMYGAGFFDLSHTNFCMKKYQKNPERIYRSGFCFFTVWFYTFLLDLQERL